MDILSDQEVLEGIYNYLDVNKDDISNLNIKLNNQENYYNISFNIDSKSYNFKIYSITGNILEVNN